MNKSDLVSIVIPAYNCEKTVSKAILSCINQTYNNIEIIVIDDGSTDKTKDCVMKMLKDYDNNNLRYIFQKNSGVSVARNNGIKNAKGKYIGFLDSDDMYHSRFVEFSVMNMLKYNTLLSISKYSTSDDILDNEFESEVQSSVIERNELINLLLYRKINFGMWSCLYDIRLFDEINICFNDKFKYGEDLEFLWKCVLKSNSATLIDEELHYYYLNDNSVTNNLSYNKVDLYRIFIEFKGTIIDNELVHKLEELLIPRIVWSICKSFSVKGKKDHFQRFLNEENVKEYLKKINTEHGIYIFISTKLLLVSKNFYYYCVKLLFGGKR